MVCRNLLTAFLQFIISDCFLITVGERLFFYFQKITLSGHKMSVWAVAAIPEKPDFYLTGSADTLIKYWNNGLELNSFLGIATKFLIIDVFGVHLKVFEELFRSYVIVSVLHRVSKPPGHEDVVRSIVVLNAHRFISASNDSSIRIWDLDAGVCINKFNSLTGEYIYRSEVSLSSQ